MYINERRQTDIILLISFHPIFFIYTIFKSDFTLFKKYICKFLIIERVSRFLDPIQKGHKLTSEKIK